MDEPELTAESLLKQAAAEDASRGSNDNDSSNEPELTDPEPGTESNADEKPKTEPAKKDEPIVSKDKEAAGTEKKTEEKPKSKWVQNEERKNKTWQEINAEKETLKAEKEAIAREKAEVAKRAKQIELAKATAEPLRDEHGFTGNDYKKVAADYRQKAYDAATPEERKQFAAWADSADQIAAKLEQKHAQLTQERTIAGLRDEWTKAHNELSAKPEYAALKDQNSDLYKGVVEILNKHPYLTQQPDGLYTAVELVDTKAQLKAFDGTKAELAKLKEEHSKLQKKLSIGGGSPTSAPEGEKDFKDLSLKEQQKRLERAAREHDRDAGFE